MTLVLLILLLAAVLATFPLIFGPRVEILPSPYPGNPFSLSLSIADQNLTPFTDLDYSCSTEHVEPASGSLEHDPKAVREGLRKRLPGREAMVALCDTAYFITTPLKSAEYKLMVRYRAFPWPQLRTREYYFRATVDSTGHVTGWTAK
jgi:hypothetical protein